MRAKEEMNRVLNRLEKEMKRREEMKNNYKYLCNDDFYEINSEEEEEMINTWMSNNSTTNATSKFNAHAKNNNIIYKNNNNDRNIHDNNNDRNIHDIEIKDVDINDDYNDEVERKGRDWVEEIAGTFFTQICPNIDDNGKGVNMKFHSQEEERKEKERALEEIFRIRMRQRGETNNQFLLKVYEQKRKMSRESKNEVNILNSNITPLELQSFVGKSFSNLSLRTSASYTSIPSNLKSSSHFTSFANNNNR